ncbi:MAG: cytochrome c [Rhodomicrobium sp.]
MAKSKHFAAAAATISITLFLWGAGLAYSADATPQPSTVSVNGIELRSLSIAPFPIGRSFAGGAEADVVNSNCLACHSAGMVLTQPTLSRDEWQGEVEKMRKTYKAPIADQDVPAIVEYLVQLRHGD